VVKEVVSEEGVEDTDWVNATWVGRTLTTLRFRRGRVGRRRFYAVPLAQLRATARAYGLLRAAPRPPSGDANGVGDAGDTIPAAPAAAPPAADQADQRSAPAAGAAAAVEAVEPVTLHPLGNSVISGFGVIVSPPDGAGEAAGGPVPVGATAGAADGAEEAEEGEVWIL
jgi:hypothetical protein